VHVNLHQPQDLLLTPPNPDEITVDDDFTVIKHKKTSKAPTKPQRTPTISAAALNTSLPSSLTPENKKSGNTQPSKEQFLTTPRQKIPPVVIHHHFQGDMTRLNKDFHTQFQPLGFTTYRMKSGIACQTSTYQDYLNLQTFLKHHKVPFNLIQYNTSKPCRVVLKGILPTTPPKTIQDELLELGFSVQNVIPMSAWGDRTPLPMHIIELDNVPQSQKILQLTHLCYIKISVEPYKGRTVPPQCARCQQFYHVAANCQAPPLAPTVLRNTVRGNATGASSPIACRLARSAKWEITAPSIEAAHISACSWKRSHGINPNLPH
jgi:hypothetical protein